MLSILRSSYLRGPWWAIVLVALFALMDIVRGSFKINLGRLPMWLKLLYVRVLVYEYGAINNPQWRMNRHQWRAAYFNLPRKLRLAYHRMKLTRAGLAPVGGGVTLQGSRSGLFWKHTPGGLPVIVDAKHFSGNVFFVDSGTAQGGTTSGFGTHPDQAVTDIESAYDLCTATQGDVVFVLPGHAETVADEITMDAAGISIIGLGEGTARPTFTQAFAGDSIAMDAANCVLQNLYWNEATTAPGSGGAAIDINAASCKVLECHFDLGADDLEAITVTATGDQSEIARNTFRITANGPDAAIEIEAVVTETWIHHNWFMGLGDTEAWDVGGINSGSAHTNCLVEYNRFSFGPAIIFSASATGIIANNLMGEGTLGSMLDPGSCMCFENYEADAINQSGRLIPTTVAS